MTEFVVTIIIAVLVLVGAVYQAWTKMKSDEEKEISDDQRRLAENELRELQKEQLLKQSHLLVKADSIILSNTKVIATQDDTLKNIVGHGYPAITAGFNGKLVLTLSNTSEYPLRNLNLTIVNWSYGLKSKMKGDTINKSDISPLTKKFQLIPVLRPQEENVIPVTYNFDGIDKLAALEIGVSAEHSSFKIFMICKHEVDEKGVGFVRYFQKAYEYDRKNHNYTLYKTNITDGNANEYMKLFFYEAPYYMAIDVN